MPLKSTTHNVQNQYKAQAQIYSQDKATRLCLLAPVKPKEIVIDICDQYTIQGDLFSKAILDNTEVPTPIEDALNNILVIEEGV